MRRLLIDHRLIKKTMGLALIFLSVATFAQTSISGTVKDPDGVGLPGATVLADGTSNGTVTDIDGNFTLEVPTESKSLTVSFVGFGTETVQLNGQTSFTISLDYDTEALQEIVVVGYGTQKKSDLTGAIASVNEKTITERGFTNPIQGIQGSMPGVQISNSTGRVGDPISIVVRGKGTFQSNNSPLFVVDGVVTDNIDFLNPNDIAKIDVLKDAASAAIYGSRGTNGVVIVQTKGGVNVPSGTSITFNSFFGTKKPARLPQMMSPEKWRHYHMSAYIATVNPNTVTNPEEFYNSVANPSSNSVLRRRFEELDGFDWYDAVLQDGMQSNNNVNISHRNGNSAYSLGLGYQTETGNIENEGLDKVTARLNIAQEITSKLKAGSSIVFTKTDNERGSDVAMREAFRLNPFLHPWAVDENGNDIEGELFPQPGKLQTPSNFGSSSYVLNKTSTYNPLLEIANSRDNTRRFNVLSSTYLQYEIIEGLSVKSTLSAGLNSYRRGKSWGVLTNNGRGNNNLASSEVFNYENYNYSWDNQIDYSKSFNGHSLQVLGLNSVFVNRTEESFMSSNNQPFETDFYNVASGLQSSYYLESDFQKTQLLSYALRAIYSFNDKYLVTVSNRWDGSSVLADDLKWNAFPSVALGWKLSNESFLSSVSPISTLKLRLSYGTTGNSNISAYSSTNVLTNQRLYDFNGSSSNGWYPGALSNKALTWEKTKEFNAGLDFGLFNYRVTGSLDLYNRLSDDVLMKQRLPKEVGFTDIIANAGSIRNSGIELALTTTNVQTSDLTWETTFTVTANKNEVVSLYGQTEVDDIGNGWFIGQPIDVKYNFEADGVWQANEADVADSYNQSEGQGKVVDQNNDGVLSPDDDRIFLGSPDPTWTGGVISRLTFKNFDFGLTTNIVQGVFGYSRFHANFTNTRDRGRQKLDIDWYIPENPYGVEPQASNEYPQPRNMGTYWRNGQNSDGERVGYYRDGSYVKINNISLGYTIPTSVLDVINANQLRIYFNVLNPFVFTDYDGYDPEYIEASYNISRVSNIIYQGGLSLKF
ncbi:MAG: SusC/RagA family TonB-linked outer membrane protein [Cyclobacteriaceae bacterium]